MFPVRCRVVHAPGLGWAANAFGPEGVVVRGSGDLSRTSVSATLPPPVSSGAAMYNPTAAYAESQQRAQPQVQIIQQRTAPVAYKPTPPPVLPPPVVRQPPPAVPKKPEICVMPPRRVSPPSTSQPPRRDEQASADARAAAAEARAAAAEAARIAAERSSLERERVALEKERLAAEQQKTKASSSIGTTVGVGASAILAALLFR